MKGRDLREYTRQTNVRLVIGGILLLFLVGDGLIWWLYGPGAAVMGLMCLFGGLLPIVLIGGILWIMEWVVKRANKE
jgi:hypothetical protein